MTQIYISLNHIPCFHLTRAHLFDEIIYYVNHADLYLYLNTDVPYTRDGTRLNKSDRDLLDKSNREVLAAHRINFIEISGGWQNRFEQAVSEISKLITTKSRR